MRLLVCGGREYHDWERLVMVLDGVHKRNHVTVLIEGGANGADSHAATWADNNGIFRVTGHANWKKFNKGAGPIRNKNMLLYLEPEGVVAFPGGSGTKDMTKQAMDAGVKTMVIE